jgi:molecular chaperone GrpE (heat shock protein)
MNDDLRLGPADPEVRPSDIQTLGSSTLYNLLEAMVLLRSRNEAQHKLFEQAQNRMRDELKTSFNSFAADTQRAYQDLRKEIQGEKKFSLGLLNELLEVGQDLIHLVASRPAAEDVEAVKKWMEGVEVESRKVQTALQRHGIKEYDAVIGMPYNPALHERVGSARVEGMGPLLVAEQRERGYASQQTDFVLRRPKVIVSE